MMTYEEFLDETKLAKQDEVFALAALISASVPDGTRLPLVFNALKHLLAAGVIGAAVSEDAAREATKLIANQLCDNVDVMIRKGWRTWE
jgi:hypothetical protein